jgi:hypothetical protein
VPVNGMALELRRVRSYARLNRLRVESFKRVKLPRIENDNIVSQNFYNMGYLIAYIFECNDNACVASSI